MAWREVGEIQIPDGVDVWQMEGANRREPGFAALNRGGVMRQKQQLTATIQFNSRGFIEHVFLNGQTDTENFIMSESLKKIIKPVSWIWVRRVMAVVWGDR